MGDIKKKFENQTKTRINLIGSANSRIPKLQNMLIKQGVFEGTEFMSDNGYTIFPTEILCSSTKSEVVSVYLSLKKEKEIIKKLKENILKSIYEACLKLENSNKKFIEEEFRKGFRNIFSHFDEVALSKFYGVDDIQKVFQNIKFAELLNELKKVNSENNQEIINEKDDFIWKNYFDDFQISFRKEYSKWMKRILKYYVDNEEGYDYLNENNDFSNKFSNKDFQGLCKILYGLNKSCALMIERAYIEAPSSQKQFSEMVYINYIKETKYKNIAKIIESRISENYKELFIIVTKSSEDMEYFKKLKNSFNEVTLNKRIFCILDEFNFYKEQLLKDKNIADYFNKEELVNTLKFNVSKNLGISQDRIIVTEQLKDIDNDTLESLDTNKNLIRLLKLINEASEKFGKSIKIKPSSKEQIISISLNQERMSVQALMTMLYERYHGYLVDLWTNIIETERHSKQYNYSRIFTIIRNRKDDYKEYKHVTFSDNTKKHKKTIDFSLRNGDYNDSKKILKMLVNYGYHTVGFDSNENKILISVNGDISKEDKENLIKSIQGRLEESSINYFESAFLMDVSRKKFNTNNLDKALEVEKNITIDDFYSAFKEVFKKMSDNIVRYEVYLQ